MIHNILEQKCVSGGVCFYDKGYCELSMNGKKGREIDCRYISKEYMNSKRLCEFSLEKFIEINSFKLPTNSPSSTQQILKQTIQN